MQEGKFSYKGEVSKIPLNKIHDVTIKGDLYVANIYAADKFYGSSIVRVNHIKKKYVSWSIWIRFSTPPLLLSLLGLDSAGEGGKIFYCPFFFFLLCGHKKSFIIYRNVKVNAHL